MIQRVEELGMIILLQAIERMLIISNIYFVLFRNTIIWIILGLLVIGLLAFIINTLRCMYISRRKRAEEDLEDLRAMHFDDHNSDHK